MTVAADTWSTSDDAVRTYGNPGVRVIEAGQEPRLVSGLESLLALAGLLLVLPQPSAAANGGWEGGTESGVRGNARTTT